MAKHSLRSYILVIYIMFLGHQIEGGEPWFVQALQAKGGGVTKSYKKYFARHDTHVGSYFGLVATMEAYGFELGYGQITSTMIWVDNSLDDVQETNAIWVGWQVNPGMYGDSRTHFFTHWTRDGYRKTGCFNMNCTGFILTDGSQIAPGGIINPVSDVDGARQKITLKVFRESSIGDWWIHYGFNSAPKAVGYYPANLFTELSKGATRIAFGSNSVAMNGYSAPPMGSGLLPSILSDKSASIEEISFVDKDGKIRPFNVDTIKTETMSSCYVMTPLFGERGTRCLYGGPGNCVL
uniref:Neprosin PEP catalytic domain-containing protein n=1 Tax=Leersia perrieri TaxID=77586 RepID=A0A0D9XGD5_9ORYZ